VAVLTEGISTPVSWLRAHYATSYHCPKTQIAKYAPGSSNLITSGMKLLGLDSSVPSDHLIHSSEHVFARVYDDLPVCQPGNILDLRKMTDSCAASLDLPGLVSSRLCVGNSPRNKLKAFRSISVPQVQARHWIEALGQEVLPWGCAVPIDKVKPYLPLHTDTDKSLSYSCWGLRCGRSYGSFCNLFSL
jgi:hypothetical protein